MLHVNAMPFNVREFGHLQILILRRSVLAPISRDYLGMTGYACRSQEVWDGEFP